MSNPKHVPPTTRALIVKLLSTFRELARTDPATVELMTHGMTDGAATGGLGENLSEFVRVPDEAQWAEPTNITSKRIAKIADEWVRRVDQSLATIAAEDAAS